MIRRIIPIVAFTAAAVGCTAGSVALGERLDRFINRMSHKIRFEM